MLSDDDGFINKDSLCNIVEQIMGLDQEGKQVIIVFPQDLRSCDD